MSQHPWHIAARRAAAQVAAYGLVAAGVSFTILTAPTPPAVGVLLRVAAAIR